MDIAPVQKGVYTLGKRTAIPGMGKFDPLSQMKVWNETVRTETDAWCASRRPALLLAFIKQRERSAVLLSTCEHAETCPCVLTGRVA